MNRMTILVTLQEVQAENGERSMTLSSDAHWVVDGEPIPCRDRAQVIAILTAARDGEIAGVAIGPPSKIVRVPNGVLPARRA